VASAHWFLGSEMDMNWVILWSKLLPFIGNICEAY